MSEHEGKKHVSLVIVGHVDAGKSTTTGRLIFDLGGIDERAMEKLQKEADLLGKSSFAFAFFMDKSKEERARGVTIACTTMEFYTKSYHYTIIDAPGHRDFIKNMITGASQADVALLMVPAGGGFTIALAKGNHKKGKVQGQSRQHAQLIKLLGVKQLIVGINKMDAPLAEYKQERYIEVREEVKNVLRSIGWKYSDEKPAKKEKGKKKDKKAKAVVEEIKGPANFPILPLAGLCGDNIIQTCDSKGKENMPWWKGVEVKKTDGTSVTVVTLLDCLETYVLPPTRDSSKAARMPVSGVYKIPGTGDVITGRIEQGVINVEDKVNFYPSHSKVPCTGVVKSVEMHHKRVKEAGSGDNVGLSVKGLKKENMPKIGDVMIRCADVAKDGHLSPAATFTAKVQVLQVPNPVKVGYSPIGFVRTARSACKIVEIKTTTYKQNKVKVTQENPAELQPNSTAEIVFEPQQMMVVETFKECEGLARLALMEGNGLVMMGNIVAVTRKDVAYGK